MVHTEASTSRSEDKGEDAETSHVLDTESCRLNPNGKHSDAGVKDPYKTTARLETWFFSP